MIWTSLGMIVALKGACALAAGEGPVRGALTAALCAMILALPFVVPLAPLPVVLLTFLSLVGIIKATQIVSSGRAWPASRRLWHMFGIVDTRLARRAPPALDVRALGVVLLNGALVLGAVFAYTRLRALSGVEYRVAWTLCAATMAVSGFEVFSGVVHVVYRAFGIDVPSVQRNPVVSRSLSESWGQRWNRVVGGWLREFMFAPLARRRKPRLGLAAAFGASGLLHAWLLIGLGMAASLQMAAYFVVQGAALFLEPRLGLRRAPPMLGRVWTIAVLLLPLPLLFGPWLDAFDLEFGLR